MAPDMFLGMAFPNRDDGPVLVGLYQVAAKVLRHTLYRFLANFCLQLANASGREVTHNAAMPVKLFIAVVNQPVADDGRDTALL